MERNLALEVVRATEAAALAAARFIGKGDERMADRAACDAMRKTLNSVAMDGKIVIGEGKEGDAEFLYEGEIVGTGAGTGSRRRARRDRRFDHLRDRRAQRAVVRRAGRARPNPAMPRHLHGQGRVRAGGARRDRYRSLADRQS